MMTGYWISQALHVVAKLNVADALAGGPRTSDELAAATGADPLALGRVMRALASVDVFRRDDANRWALRPLGELLRTDRPGSMRPLALMYGGEQYAAWAGLEHSVTTGAAAFPHTFGADYFDYLQAHPDADQVFNEAMTGLSVHLFAAVIESYDFTSFGTIVDVGGSYGALLTTVLRAAPEARGILFDQPHVAAIAAERLAAGDVADRCTTVGGDFFAELPTGRTRICSPRSCTTGTTQTPRRYSPAVDGRSPPTERCSSSTSSCRRPTSPPSASGSTCT